MALCYGRRFIGTVKGMKRRPAPKSSRTRSQWWSCVLSVLVALSLLVRPSDICALVESSPGHSHAHASQHSDGASPGHAHNSVEEHDHSHHHGSHHDGGTQHESSPGDGRMSLSTPEAAHACCSDTSAPHPVVAASLRSFQADDSFSLELFAAATLPLSPDIFALTACHGRDGPPDRSLRSQFVPSSQLGRAPPALA